MALLSFNVDALTAGQGLQAIDSFMALSIFLVFNHLVVWIIGALQKERRQSYKKETHQRMLYEVTSKINQLFAQHVDQSSTLFTKMCEILVNRGPFRQACVTVLDAKLLNDGYLSVCTTSQQSQFVSLDTAKERSPLLEGVVSSKKPIFLNQAGSCAETVLNADCAPDCNSLAAIPVVVEQRVIAVISLYSNEFDTFSSSTIDMLIGITNDLCFTMEIQQQRQRLKQVAEVFQHSHEAILITEPDGTIIDVNPSFTRITGYSAEEVKGKNPRFLKSGVQDPEFYKGVFETLKKEKILDR